MFQTSLELQITAAFYRIHELQILKYSSSSSSVTSVADRLLFNALLVLSVDTDSDSQAPFWS